MRCKQLLCIILLFSLAVACSPAGGEATAPAATEPAATSEATATSEPAATPTVEAESGIEGQALIGPMCPVEQIGTECPDQPYQANVTIVDESGREVTRLTTGTDGRFQVVLAPGTYVLQPETGKPFPQATNQTVTVRPGEFTQVVILYDNGIQ